MYILTINRGPSGSTTTTNLLFLWYLDAIDECIVCSPHGTDVSVLEDRCSCDLEPLECVSEYLSFNVVCTGSNLDYLISVLFDPFEAKHKLYQSLFFSIYCPTTSCRYLSFHLNLFKFLIKIIAMYPFALQICLDNYCFVFYHYHYSLRDHVMVDIMSQSVFRFCNYTPFGPIL
jgi:hypothetical protein